MTFRPRPKRHLFPLGQVVSTPAAVDVIHASDETVADLLERHATGDWGNVSPEDRDSNYAAIRGQRRVHSVYEIGGREIWAITEADRSVTTLLLPEEY